MKLRLPCLVHAFVALLMALFSQPGSAAGVQSSPKELVFLNWADYVDPEVMQEFERKFDVQVKQIFFESEEARDSLLIEEDGKGYDVALVTGIRMKLYRSRGWIAPIDEQAVPNLKHIDPRWIKAYESAVGYGVPYFWGMTGIAFRSDIVPEEIKSWKDFFRPPDALRGKIGMTSDATEVVGAALKALGYSYNSADPNELTEAEALLLSQKPYVRRYLYFSTSEDSALVTGDIAAAMAYNGDSLMLSEYEPCRYTHLVVPPDPAPAGNGGTHTGTWWPDCPPWPLDSGNPCRNDGGLVICV